MVSEGSRASERWRFQEEYCTYLQQSYEVGLVLRTTASICWVFPVQVNTVKVVSSQKLQYILQTHNCVFNSQVGLHIDKLVAKTC